MRCDIDARADFVRANQRVLEDARGIEAKQRREGLMRHEDELVGFFEGKLPQDIADSRALDAWYRKARPAEQAALRWSLDDVMSGGAGLDPRRRFPATLDISPPTLSPGIPLRARRRGRRRHPASAAGDVECAARRTLRMAGARIAGGQGGRTDPRPAQGAATQLRAGAGFRPRLCRGGSAARRAAGQGPGRFLEARHRRGHIGRRIRRRRTARALPHALSPA